MTMKDTNYKEPRLHYSNNKLPYRERSLEETYQYFDTEFAGLQIPRNCIKSAFDRCFKGACDQEMLNRDVKNYLIKNLARM